MCGSALFRAIMQVRKELVCVCACVAGVGTVGCRLEQGRKGKGEIGPSLCTPIAYLVASTDPRDDISCAQFIITLRRDTCVTCTRPRVYVHTRARLIFVFANQLPCRDSFVTFVILVRRNRMAAAGIVGTVRTCEDTPTDADNTNGDDDDARPSHRRMSGQGWQTVPPAPACLTAQVDV